MWWLFFYHLSEIKWIFHLSEIIVHYRKDFSQNKRGQSEHRLTGEVKPTGLFYFSNSRFVYTDDSLAHFLLPKQLFPTLHFPLCRCTFMVKFLQHQKYAIHARRLRLLRLKKKKKKRTFNSFPLEIEVSAAWSWLSWWFHTNVLARCRFFQQHIAVLFLLLHLWSE